MLESFKACELSLSICARKVSMKLPLSVIALATATLGPDFLFVLTCSWAAPLSPPASGDLRGIYVDSRISNLTRKDSIALAQSMTVPGVDGFTMVAGWKYLEPAKGIFSWAAFDAWMKTAVSAGKKIELSIPAMYDTPSWLFLPSPDGAGLVPLDFSYTRRPMDTTCLADTLAAPWDVGFLALWDAMLDSVSEHLKSTGMYDAVVLLRLTGINKDSDELHLPSETSGPPCSTNNVAIWQAAGYRPSRILVAWDSITTSFKRYFPDKSFSVAIIAIADPFPAIDDNDSIITGTVPNQNFPLLQLAARKFPGHLVIQNNTLYPNISAQPETIASAESLKTMIAFQTNQDIAFPTGKGAACGGRNDTTVCTDSTYLNELQTGIYPKGPGDRLRAQYIEVFAPNVNALPEIILQAHNELVAPTTSVVGQSQPTVPGRFALRQNYPNPFNPSTMIQYTIAGTRGYLPAGQAGGTGDSEVRLIVYDMLGREVAILVDKSQVPGTYGVRFDGANLASGIYTYRLTAGNFVAARSMLLLK